MKTIVDAAASCCRRAAEEIRRVLAERPDAVLALAGGRTMVPLFAELGRMVEAGEDCSKVLVQLSAVKASINSTGKLILKDHISHCVVDAIEHGDRETLEALNEAIDQFIK